MIWYYICRYLGPIHNLKKISDTLYQGGFPAACHNKDTIKIYYTIKNLLHIEGHISNNMYINHFHKTFSIPQGIQKRNINIHIQDGYITIKAVRTNID